MSIERRETVDRLLREANVLRVRKQYAEAETRCRQALELVPHDLSGLEMLCDLLYEKGSLDEAKGLCQRALELQPGRPAAEKRLAQITLELAERERQRLIAQNLIAGGGPSRGERKRRVTIALLLSLLWPGAGQLYNGEYVKAAILGLTYFACLAFGGERLLALLFSFAPGGPRAEVGAGAALGIIAFAVWIYGVIDAPMRAQKLSSDAIDLV